MSDRPFVRQDHDTADAMSSYWANFVTHGDPNGKGVAHWPPVGNKPLVMEVGNDFRQVSVADSPAKFAFWKNLLLACSE